MTAAVAEKLATNSVRLTKSNPAVPALEVLGGTVLALRAGITIEVAGRVLAFNDGANIRLDAELVAGDDFVVAINDEDKLGAFKGRTGDWDLPYVIGGGHFAPGAPAGARAGGDAVPGFDPFSLWDVAFRPACPDPRGMVFVAGSRGAPGCAPFWIDKYLLARDHLEHGTSWLGATIADGRNKPQKLDGSGGYLPDLNYHTAKAVLAHHGKSLPSLEEFFAAAYGVTEKSAAGDREEATVLDAPRTSACGVVQATGQRWVWGHDGDPDEPRASLFGGGYWVGDSAGSRYACVGSWPGYSVEGFGARGRSDHLHLCLAGAKATAARPMRSSGTNTRRATPWRSSTNTRPS